MEVRVEREMDRWIDLSIDQRKIMNHREKKQRVRGQLGWDKNDNYFLGIQEGWKAKER